MTRRRVLIAVLLAAAVFGILPRAFQADRFRAPIQRGLEASLGRKVEIKGAISYSLIPRPGFAIENVYIHELPSAGVEPFAWVSELTFHVSLTGLLSGHVELAGIQLHEPHINLMKQPDGPWNFQPFLDHALVSRTSGATLPAIEITNGRLNFKSGDTKSVLYLDATDLTVEADPSSSGRFGIKFDGEPARTDRSARALGRLSGRGMLQLGRSRGAESTIDLSLQSDRAAIAEIVTLIEGRSIGLGGFVTSRFRLSGPLPAIAIEGNFDLDDAGRFSSLLPGGSNRGLRFTGRLDLPGQEMLIETAPAGQSVPLSFRLRAAKLLSHPSWSMLLTANKVPLSSLRSLLSETGVNIPADVPSESTLTGALGFTHSGGMQGMIVARDGSVPVEGARPVRFAEAVVAVSGSEIRLFPTVFEVGEAKKQVAVQARYDAASGAREVKLQTAPIALDEVRPLWTSFTGGNLPALLAYAEKGVIQGSIQLQQLRDGASVWNADFGATDIVAAFDEIPGSVRAASVLVSIRGNAVALRKLDGRVGKIPVTGTFDWDPAARVPARFRLTIPEASISGLEPFFASAFPRRRQGIIDRTLRRTSPPPGWLSSRRAAGELRIGKLTVGDYRLDNSVARLDWTGSAVEATEWKATAGDGTFTGSLSVQLSGAEPVYKGRFETKGMHWQDGRLDTSGTVETSGFGAEAIARLRMTGGFRAWDVTLAPGQEWQTATGSFTWTGSAASRLQVRGIEVAAGQETYQGQANSSPEGRLVIELTGAQKQLRLAGRMSGLQFEASPQQ